MTDLMTGKAVVGDGNSSIVITKYLAGIPSGVALDTSLLSGVSVVRAGHVVLLKDGKYYAAGVTGAAYSAFGDKTPVGVLNADVLVNGGRLAPVMTIGQVRDAASPYTISEEVKKALPRIEFI
jgi:hypothetical protein